MEKFKQTPPKAVPKIILTPNELAQVAQLQRVKKTFEKIDPAHVSLIQGDIESITRRLYQIQNRDYTYPSTEQSHLESVSGLFSKINWYGSKENQELLAKTLDVIPEIKMVIDVIDGAEPKLNIRLKQDYEMLETQTANGLAGFQSECNHFNQFKAIVQKLLTEVEDMMDATDKGKIITKKGEFATFLEDRISGLLFNQEYKPNCANFFMIGKTDEGMRIFEKTSYFEDFKTKIEAEKSRHEEYLEGIISQTENYKKWKFYVINPQEEKVITEHYLRGINEVLKKLNEIDNLYIEYIQAKDTPSETDPKSTIVERMSRIHSGVNDIESTLNNTKTKSDIFLSKMFKQACLDVLHPLTHNPNEDTSIKAIEKSNQLAIQISNQEISVMEFRKILDQFISSLHNT